MSKDNTQKDKILDKETTEKIKQELLEKKKQILVEMKSISGDGGETKKHKVKFPDFGNKNDESAQEIDQYSTNLATEKVLENSLRDINNALVRIEKGCQIWLDNIKKNIYSN